LRDSLRPSIGIEIVSFATLDSRGVQTVGLVTDHDHARLGEVHGAVTAPPATTVASRCVSAPKYATVSSKEATTTGRWKMDPALARRVLGLKGSTDCPLKMTALAPAASASE